MAKRTKCNEPLFLAIGPLKCWVDYWAIPNGDGIQKIDLVFGEIGCSLCFIPLKLHTGCLA